MPRENEKMKKNCIKFKNIMGLKVDTFSEFNGLHYFEVTMKTVHYTGCPV